MEKMFPVYYAVVYIPAGYNVNAINIPGEGAANNLYMSQINLL